MVNDGGVCSGRNGVVNTRCSPGAAQIAGSALALTLRLHPHETQHQAFPVAQMQLLVIRHGIAENPSAVATGQDDSGPPLSKEGRKMMKGVAAGLRQLVEEIGLIGASPLLRAQQTAQIVARAYNDLPVVTVEDLLPESDPPALMNWLRQHSTVGVVAIVGHQPNLGRVVTWLMSGVKDPRVDLTKGGTCLLEFSASVSAGNGTLQWLLTPSLLRRIED
jgi:phosphohistidine phosphatase